MNIFGLDGGYSYTYGGKTHVATNSKETPDFRSVLNRVSLSGAGDDSTPGELIRDVLDAARDPMGKLREELDALRTELQETRFALAGEQENRTPLLEKIAELKTKTAAIEIQTEAMAEQLRDEAARLDVLKTQPIPPGLKELLLSKSEIETTEADFIKRNREK